MKDVEIPIADNTFLQRQWRGIRRQIRPVLAFAALLWICYGVNLLLPSAWQLNQWGIRPRRVEGLEGIAFAPFLHESFGHLVQNTLPLLVLGWLVILSGRLLFLGVLLVSGLSSGLGAWVFGSGTVHIGASGLVFGMLGFLLARGWVARRVGWTLISVLVGLMYYGNIFNGLLPVPHLSWSSHFWGFLGGIGFAWWLYRHKGLPAPARIGGGGGTIRLVMRKSEAPSVTRKSKALSGKARR